MSEPSRNPDCSIIIPVWNGTDFIRTSIASALAQVDVSVEIIVVDDVSTDDTVALVQSIDDNRIRCISRSVNGGPAAARNDGLAHALGRWVAVLDADDEMSPDRISGLIRTAEAREVDLITDNMWIIRTDEASLHFDEKLDGTATPITLLDMYVEGKLFSKGRGYGYLKPLFRRDFLCQHNLKYQPELRIAEDFQFVVDCLAAGAKYFRVASAGYKYTARIGSISHRLKPGHVEAMIAVELKFLKEFDEKLSSIERIAIQNHLANLENAASFNRMVASIKDVRPRHFFAECLKHPLALRHFSMPIYARLRAISRSGRTDP